MSEITKSKALKAFELRESGMTLREIGKEIGTCGSRAGILIESHKRRIKVMANGALDLSNRTINALSNARIENSAVSIRRAIESGLLNPKNNSIRNYGWKGYKELCEAVGIPDPTPAKRPHCCPNCGFRISTGKESK